MCLCLSFVLPANSISLYLAGESRTIMGRISHPFCVSGQPDGCDADSSRFPAFLQRNHISRGDAGTQRKEGKKLRHSFLCILSFIFLRLCVRKSLLRKGLVLKKKPPHRQISLDRQFVCQYDNGTTE
jgi:hypothetical protein